MFKKPTAHPETCDRCPNRFSERGCPCWVKGVVETNPVTGEVRATEGCFYQLMPQWIVHVIQAANRPAAQLCQIRDQVLVPAMEELHRKQDALAEGLSAACALVGGELMQQVQFAPQTLLEDKSGQE